MPPRSSHRPAVSPVPRVAVLVDTSTTWGRDIITGIHNYSRTHGGWHLFLEARGAMETMALPDGWQGDGVIARVGTPELARHLREKRIPAVNVSGIQLQGAAFPCVINDVPTVARLAVDYFMDRGFKHFAYLSLKGLEYVARQRDAYVARLAALGIKCITRDIDAHVGFQSPDWNLKVDELGAWLDSLPKPVALFTWSGGREVIHACLQTGLRVPEEVAVLNGSEDALLGEFSPIPVSGIQADGQKIGFQAAELLDRLMNGATPPAATVVVPPIKVVSRQSTETTAVTDRALVTALGFIRENAMRPIQVTEVAAHAGLSRRVLERRFWDVLGRSPADHIGNTRLDRVKSLLLETDMAVGDIANYCGFCSPEYMTAVFKKEMRTTPLRYRREARNQ